MGETNTTESDKPTFEQIIKPLGVRHNELVAEKRQGGIGKDSRELDREISEAYGEMIDKTSKTILEMPKEERESIIDTAIKAFNGEEDELKISVPPFRIQAFTKHVLLKTVELAESRSQQIPQK